MSSGRRHFVILPPRRNSVAFGLKRTSVELYETTASSGFSLRRRVPALSPFGDTSCQCLQRLVITVLRLIQRECRSDPDHRHAAQYATSFDGNRNAGGLGVDLPILQRMASDADATQQRCEATRIEPVFRRG
jgi:hypothetical protein